MIYKVYGNCQDGWVQIGLLYQAKDVRNFVDQVDSYIYDSVIVISHDFAMNTDEVYMTYFFDREKERRRVR